MNGPAAPPIHPGPTRTRLTAVLLLATVMSMLTVVVVLSDPMRAYAAAGPTVNLGTAGAYSVLAGSTVTNTGPTVLDANLGVSPGTAITGFPPGIAGGATHAGDAVAIQAKSDLTIAYNDAAGRASDGDSGNELGGQTFVAGVYTDADSQGLTGTVTLDGQGDPNSVFIFQTGAALITASNSTVSLINGAQACNVFWQVGSSATLGVGTTFVGTVMALTSVSVNTGATVEGRALARNGAVTLDNNVFTSSTCNVASPTPSDSPTASDSPSPSDSPTASDSPSSSDSPTASDSPSSSDSPTASDSPSSSDSPTASISPSPSGSSTPPISTATSSANVSPIETSSASAIASSDSTGNGSGGNGSGGSGSGDNGSGSGGSLARTGSSGLMLPVGLGGIALLLAAGSTLVLSRRNRYHRRH